MKFFTYALLFLSCVFLFSPQSVHAGSCSSNGAGTAWNVGSNWTAGCTGVGGVPSLGDNVTIAAGNPITLNTIPFGLGTLTVNDLLNNASGLSYLLTASNIVINSGGELRAGNANINLTGTSGTLLTVNAGGTFTPGTSTVITSGNGNATIAAGNPTFYNLSITGTGTKSQGSEISFANGGTLSVTNGTFSAVGDSINTNGNSTLSVTNATITVPTAFHVDYPFTTVNLGTGSTVDYNQGSPQTVYQPLTYYNLKISGSFTKSISGTTTVLDTLTIAGGTFDTDGHTLNAGRVVMDGGTFTPESSTVNLTGTSGTLFYVGSGTMTPGTSTFNLTGNGDAVVVEGGQSFYNLTSSGTGTKSIGSGFFGITSGGTFSVTNGTFDAGTSSSNANSTNTTMSVTNATVKIGATVFENNFSGFSTYTFGSGSTIEYNRAGAQTIDSAKSYVNLTTSGSGTKSLNGTTTVTGTLTVGGTSTFSTTASNHALNVGYISLAGGNFGPNSSTITITGTSGTLISVTSGGQTIGASTFVISGNGNARLLSSGASGWGFYNLTLSGTGTKTAGASFNIASPGTLSVTNGVFDPETYTISGVAGAANLSVTNGTLYIKTTAFSDTFNSFGIPSWGAGSTVEYNGSSAQTIDNSASYYNLTISGTARGIYFPITGTTTVTNIFVTQGTPGNPINLLSASNGTGWRFAPTGSASASYVHVRDSACTSSVAFVTQTEVRDLGNNGSCWVRNGAVFIPRVAPTGLTVTKPDFTINAGASQVSSPVLTLSFTADPATVSGYAVSLDPTFSDASLRPYGGPATTGVFTLPEKSGDYSVYVVYVSNTGDRSEIMSRRISYLPGDANVLKNKNQVIKNQFNRTLKLGSEGADVSALQKLLIKDGVLVWPTATRYGYFGRLTEKAVQAFQEKYQIAQKKDSGYGVFGPKTRAHVNQL